MLRQREILKHRSVREPVVLSGTHEGQVQIASVVPALGGETGCTLWVVEQHSVTICCPLNQTLSVGCIGSLSPLHILAIEVISIHTWGREHQKGTPEGNTRREHQKGTPEGNTRREHQKGTPEGNTRREHRKEHF